MASDKKPDGKKPASPKPEEKSRMEKGGKAATNVSIISAAIYAGFKTGQTTFSVTKRPLVSLATGTAAAVTAGIGLSRGANKAADMLKKKETPAATPVSGKAPPAKSQKKAGAPAPKTAPKTAPSHPANKGKTTMSDKNGNESNDGNKDSGRKWSGWKNFGAKCSETTKDAFGKAAESVKNNPGKAALGALSILSIKGAVVAGAIKLAAETDKGKEVIQKGKETFDGLCDQFKETARNCGVDLGADEAENKTAQEPKGPEAAAPEPDAADTPDTPEAAAPEAETPSAPKTPRKRAPRKPRGGPK